MSKLKIGVVAGILPEKAFAFIQAAKKQAAESGICAQILSDWESPRPDGEDDLMKLRDEKMLALEASLRLQAQGADAIVIPSEKLESYKGELQAELTAPVVALGKDECPHCAAKAVIENTPVPVARGFKLGLIGGLGPAATVDLFDKIVKATPASTDQEHFKLVIEENPQIPDRTACLLEGKTDPTLALFHCAKRLEEDGCDAVIIPCNTAHAFLPYITRRLNVPFVDMQVAALDDIQTRFKEPKIGLLATSGTIKTGIYSRKAEKMGLPLFTPDEEHQKLVMSAIYGPKGAKAGYTDGICREELLKAAEYMVREKGCNVLILGCTELPLILDETDSFPLAGTTVAFVDPTAVLGRKVAKIAMDANAKRGAR